MMPNVMEDPVEGIKGACRDLSESISGLEVADRAEYDLRISNPMLALWLQPLSRESANDVPNPPNPFDSQTSLLGESSPVPTPWLAPTREYADRYLDPYNKVVVAFADYGEVSTGASASTHERRADRQTEQKQEALSELGIDPERQLIITLDGRVRESITHRLAAYHLKTHGWFVSTDFQYLPPGGPGAPDIVAWKSPFTTAIKEAGLVRNGALLEELAYLHHLDREFSGKAPAVSDDVTTKTLVAEVKGEKRSLGEAHTQLQKYIRWNAFDSGYCVVPGYRGHEQSGAGILTFDARGIDFIPDQNTHYVSEQRQCFLEYMNTAARQALLCGLPFPDLVELATSGVNGIDTPHELAMQLRSLNSESIIDAVLAQVERNH